MIGFTADKTPLYVQVKNYIYKMIVDDIWPVGFKLPPERELAKELDVSRKTVNLAYKELEKEGFLSSHQGKGTFVIDKPLNIKEGKIDKLASLVDDAIEKSFQLGIEEEEFLDLCKARIKEYSKSLKELKLILIECNKEQLDYFCRELEISAEVNIVPILLQDFKRNAEQINQKINSSDFVVTTVFHIDEVSKLLNDKIEIIPISLHPQLESIIKIARIDPESTIGILSISENFALKVKNSLKDSGMKFKNISVSVATRPESIKKYIQNLDVIIVSPSRKKDVLPFIKQTQEVIEFIFVPDVGSINLLKSVLIKKH
ncbi:MAG: GntR family transcriptional regulator [Tepidanaerobacteraceae bacterium]|jgi:DNA-binding transcriptional regulator YhcF (GntR family)